MISANRVAGRPRGNGSPVLSARQFIGAATTALSLITGAFLLALAAGHARAPGPARACGAGGEVGRLPPPGGPRGGRPPRGIVGSAKSARRQGSFEGPGCDTSSSASL